MGLLFMGLVFAFRSEEDLILTFYFIILSMDSGEFSFFLEHITFVRWK